LAEYVGYFNHWRPHRSIGQRAPCAPAAGAPQEQVHWLDAALGCAIALAVLLRSWWKDRRRTNDDERKMRILAQLR
jgi:hypothetical protein